MARPAVRRADRQPTAGQAGRASWLVLGLWTVIAAGCEAPVPPEAQGRDVIRPHQGFAINVPEGWTFRDLGGDVVLEVYPSPSGPQAAAAGDAAPRPAAETPPAAPGPEPARAKPLLAAVQVAVTDRGGLGLGAWADQTIEESKVLQPDLEVVQRQAARLADGREALLLVLKNPRGLVPTVQRMLLAMTDQRACAVVATAPEPDWPKVEGAFQKCFESFVVW
jgi:hypothetical protein